jgi:uncharacterized protein with GYD domain
MRARLKAFNEGETWPSQAEACAPARRQGCGLAKQLSALEGDIMATYVTLYNFTDQGLKNIKDTVKRTEAAKKAAAAVGATIKELVWTQGQYDMVAITEVSDEVAATAFGLHTLTHGNVRAQTMRAFTAAEMEKILEKVG